MKSTSCPIRIIILNMTPTWGEMLRQFNCGALTFFAKLQWPAQHLSRHNPKTTYLGSPRQYLIRINSWFSTRPRADSSKRGSGEITSPPDEKPGLEGIRTPTPTQGINQTTTTVKPAPKSWYDIPILRFKNDQPRNRQQHQCVCRSKYQY